MQVLARMPAVEARPHAAARAPRKLSSFIPALPLSISTPSPRCQMPSLRGRGRGRLEVSAIGGLFGKKDKQRPKRNDADVNADGSSATDYNGEKASLDGSTEWRLQLRLEEGSSPIVITVKFELDEGYEPPQGVMQVISDPAGAVAEGQKAIRWQLSEEPEKEDPLDGGGLWVWGLFDEPLYPFILFSLDITAAGGFPGGRVFAQLPHARGSRRGAIISEGPLTTREAVTYKADLVGLSDAVVEEKQPCGRATCSPLGRYADDQ